jgi:membrane protease YdiL (CAAX protease family)
MSNLEYPEIIAIARIISQGLFVLYVMLFLITGGWVYYLVIVGLIILHITDFIFSYYAGDKGRAYVSAIIGTVLLFAIACFRDFNYFHSLYIRIPDISFAPFKSLEGFWTDSFWGFYGVLVFSSLLLDVVMSWKLYTSKEPVLGEEPIEDTFFGSFLVNRTPRKMILLFIMLCFAAMWEEIIFRFIVMNALNFFDIELIIIVIVSSLIFGLEHYKVGGWWHVVSSFLAGILFAFCFLNFGIEASAILHLFWNFFHVMLSILALVLKNQRQYLGDK